jgi:CRP/FNR family cyclic AMP-dependent transcriptional regulator
VTVPPESDLQILRAVPYFSSLTAAELVQIHPACLLRRFQAEEIVLLEGAPSLNLFILRSGSVCMYKTSWDGKEQVLRIVQPGETFNDVPVFDGRPCPWSVKAVNSCTTVWELQGERVLQLLATHPHVARAVTAVLAGRLRQLTDIVGDLAFRHTVERLACLLLKEWADTGWPVALTQQEMAARVGTAREVVNRALRELERRGAITREHHRIVRVNPRCLRALLGPPVPDT